LKRGLPFHRPHRSVHRVFLHCSASDRPEHDDIEVIRRWHLQRGFKDVGYHYFIRKNGELQRGRSPEMTPAAQKGHNLHTLAICLHGLRKERFSEAQFDTLRQLSLAIDEAYSGRVSFHGHCEVSPKACPVFDYRKVLKLDRYGTLGLEGAKALPLDDRPLSGAYEEFPRLRLGSRGKAVEELQELLFVRVDGIFGPQTARAVRRFRKEAGLTGHAATDALFWEKLLERTALEDGAV